MALKPDRSIVGNQTSIDFFYNSTAEKGEVMVYSTAGSGAAMDDANAVVTRPSASASGQRYAGILLNDVVNKDLTQTHLNFQKDEVQQGSKVTLTRAPSVLVTDMIKSGDTPAVGDPLYFTLYTHNATDETNRGVLTVTPVADSGALGLTDDPVAQRHQYRIAEAISTLDADNYFKVQLKDPQ